MAISKTLAKKSTDTTIEDIKPVLYLGLQAMQIKLTNGKVGFMSMDRYNLEMPKWPTSDGTDDGDLMLPSDYRLSNRAYWTNLQRSSGVGEVVLPGE